MKKYDQQLERIHALKNEPVSPALVTELRKAIGNRNNYMVGKAAGVAAHHRLAELTPDLLKAFDRFMQDPVRTDTQCWAKNGIVAALAELGHDDPDVYIAGLSHVQMEPVWNRQEDTAGTLRAQSALALIQCRSVGDTRLLSFLLPTLVDKDKTVRMEGAKAIGNVNRTEAALLLRLKALTGDEEPEVTGACLVSVLAIERQSALDFVRPFLEKESDLAAEAALALGLARLPQAVPMLAERYRRERDMSLSSVLLTALAVSHQPEAANFLLEEIESGSANRAISAMEAIISARMAVTGVLESAARNVDPTVLASARAHFA